MLKMSTSKMIALIFFVVAIVIFVLTGFNIVNEADSDMNLVALGWGSFATGYVIQHYIP